MQAVAQFLNLAQLDKEVDWAYCRVHNLHVVAVMQQ